MKYWLDQILQDKLATVLILFFILFVIVMLDGLVLHLTADFTSNIHDR